jgi:hypothetical protein
VTNDRAKDMPKENPLEPISSEDELREYCRRTGRPFYENATIVMPTGDPKTPFLVRQVRNIVFLGKRRNKFSH